MSALTREIVRTKAPIPTWFGVGGRADHYAEPETVEALGALVEEFRGDVRVLGEGANLLVEDAGVGGLVVSLKALRAVRRITGSGSGSGADSGAMIVRAGAGASLPRLIVDTVREGLGGLEGLGGIPATVGGAVRMNAGGAFGEIADAVVAVRGLTRAGRMFERSREETPFAYRGSGLSDSFITEVDFSLTPGDAVALRDRLKHVMAAKKTSQPMAERSAGCVFKNPLVDGARVSAGRLIDSAGAKGMRVGAASVSAVHANFIVVEPGGCAQDVLTLIDEVRALVRDGHGVTLEPEVVVWRRDEEG